MGDLGQWFILLHPNGDMVNMTVLLCTELKNAPIFFREQLCCPHTHVVPLTPLLKSLCKLFFPPSSIHWRYIPCTTRCFELHEHVASKTTLHYQLVTHMRYTIYIKTHFFVQAEVAYNFQYRRTTTIAKHISPSLFREDSNAENQV